MTDSNDPIFLRKIALQVLILLGALLGILAWSQRPEAAVVWLTAPMDSARVIGLSVYAAAALFTAVAVMRARSRAG